MWLPPCLWSQGQLWCASGSEGRLTFYHCREVEEQQVTTAAAAEVAGQLVLVEAFSITLPRPVRLPSGAAHACIAVTQP